MPVTRVPARLPLDLNMPGGSSIAAISRLARTWSGMSIVVLTMEDDPAFAREASAAGASGFVLKSAGATVSSETADAVITVDRIDRVADAVHIGRRSLGIARQSVIAGMSLSIAAMGVAAAGYLAPVTGALLQEAIDLAVILNALRALRD
jgi:CheY-like chemotaxis protein